MLNVGEDTVLITREACDYLRISRPTYLKYLQLGRIKGIKAGKGWRVLKTELDRFLKGGSDAKGDEADFDEKAIVGSSNMESPHYKILVVDDEEPIRKLIATILSPKRDF